MSHLHQRQLDHVTPSSLRLTYSIFYLRTRPGLRSLSLSLSYFLSLKTPDIYQNSLYIEQF